MELTENLLSQAVRFCLRRQANGKQVQMVVRLFSRLMAKGAGPEDIQGTPGTADWNWQLDDRFGATMPCTSPSGRSRREDLAW